jgi:iron-sulfur cluster assembly protein
MLEVTESAGKAINELASSPGSPEAGGMRISVAGMNDDGADLALTVVDRPWSGDQVVVGALDSHVFLQPEVAEILQDQVLDARREEDGKIRFSLLAQE